MTMIDQKIIKRKLHTLFANPKGVITKYKRRFPYWLRRDLMPIYDEDYDLHWNYRSFKYKKILDLGADYGSTASYFLRKGAKQVVAVEGDHDLASKLKSNFVGDIRVIPIEQKINSAVDIASLISSHSPDLVKVDIEGSECYLLKCSDNTLKKVDEWLIETHTSELYKDISQRFLRLGFKVFGADYVNQLKIIVAVFLNRFP